MARSVLLTAAEEDAAEIKLLLTDTDTQLVHAPLEIYALKEEDEELRAVLQHLEEFDTIVHSSIRNARFFLEQVERQDVRDAVTQRVNIAFDAATFHWLEEQGIPAIHPQNGEKPIDTVELMLRLQRMGKTLYPCGAHQRDDFPGFLEELDIAVTELDVFDLQGPEKHVLKGYRKKIAAAEPDTVIFHSRRSVTRTLAAFPDLDYEQLTILSADKGITHKLKRNDLPATHEANGSWQSIADLL